MLLIAFYLILSTFAVDCKNSGNSCEAGQCDTIGDTEICMQCNQGKVPINGICTAHSEEAVTNAGCKKNGGTNIEESDKVCGQCGNGYFLHKGGCYKIGEAPGNLICADEASNPGARTAGVCGACKDGYYKNSDAVATADSCIACEDANCATCGGAGENKCTKCIDGYFVGATGNEGGCIKCDATTGPNSYKGVAGCAKCEKPKNAGPAKCIECAADYLKTEADEQTSCVSEAVCREGKTHFPTTDSAGGNKKVCVSCGTTNNGGIENCGECTSKESAARAGTEITCTKCSSNNLSPWETRV